jgi:hypothetical protein
MSDVIPLRKEPETAEEYLGAHPEYQTPKERLLVENAFQAGRRAGFREGNRRGYTLGYDAGLSVGMVSSAGA